MNHDRSFLVVTLLLLAATLAGCGDEQAAKAPAAATRFAFDSGGRHHIEGLGAWRWSMERSAGGTTKVSVRHDVREDSKTYPPFALTAPEADALWRAVEAARLGSLKPVERPGVPDEVMLAFELSRPGKDVRVALWQNDLRAHPRLVAVVDRLRALIEAHCGVRPAF